MAVSDDNQMCSCSAIRFVPEAGTGARKAVLGEVNQEDRLTAASDDDVMVMTGLITIALKSSKPPSGLPAQAGFPNSPAQAAFLPHLPGGCQLPT